mmetsp:Transcript_11057/g.20002  ORF Transcript_11057/g.20002 Transcript_11057/m.20002 type:complete len:88 (+) Transcript_11057:483-746(+)
MNHTHQLVVDPSQMSVSRNCRLPTTLQFTEEEGKGKRKEKEQVKAKGTKTQQPETSRDFRFCDGQQLLHLHGETYQDFVFTHSDNIS